LKEKIDQYQQRINNYNLQRAKFRQFQKYFPVSRFVSFIICCFLAYHSVATQNIFLILSTIIVFIGFLFLGWLDIQYKNKITQIDHLTEINQNEILALHGNYSKNEPGDEFTDFDHPYSYDLDMFGKNSLFHCINRTSTIYGKNKLANYFRNAFQYKDEISARQEAIRELCNNIEFRQQLQLIFYKQKTNESDNAEITNWLQSNNIPARQLNRNKLFVYIINSVVIISIVLSITGLIPWHVPFYFITLQWLMTSRLIRKILKTQDVISSKFKILGKYSQGLSLLENTNFKSTFLSDLKIKLTDNEEKSPGKAINELFQLINFMDTNLNLLVAVILNGLFAFNIHLIIAVESWKNKYKDFIPRWFEILGEMDALTSLGNFANNNPDYIFPEEATGDFVFSTQNMGHPLISKETCIKNDLEIKSWKQICIITGANMSGKSTLLRTIGTNYILAMTGSPVCADKFIFQPIEVHTSMRTNDSLAKNESYFYAELKRLKEIIDELEMGKSKFILLDEILKGTNSKDKRTGSMALVNQLIKYKIIAMVATHDQVLGELINDYPENISNLCFEISIVNDKMQIDYKIRKGICQNLNATFLMKNMGIILPN